MISKAFLMVLCGRCSLSVVDIVSFTQRIVIRESGRGIRFPAMERNTFVVQVRFQFQIKYRTARLITAQYCPNIALICYSSYILLREIGYEMIEKVVL